MACASFEVVRRAGGGEILVTKNSSSPRSIVAVVGSLSSQIMSRSSRGSLEKFVKADMLMVVVVKIAVFGKGNGSGGI